MAKSEFLQLCHKYDPQKHFVGNWFLSTKLDGIRAFWDGGVTSGILANQVPWANTEKDKREIICTGLWSRYGKVIHAPAWWTAHIPKIPLDGELYCGPRSWQELSSIVKRLPENQLEKSWTKIKFMILDSPPLERIFENKIINTTNYKKTFNEIIKSSTYLEKVLIKPQPFIFVYEKLNKIIDSEYCMVHEQFNIPLHNSRQYIEEQLEKVIELGGEGIVIRNPMSTYECCRSHNVLKYKPYLDDEGTVIGYIWGTETELGSKLLGLMGSLIIKYKDKEFNLSGFTDSERKMVYVDHRMGKSANNEGICCPGERVNPYIENPKFPYGTTITFRYRELSDRGIPKEARFFRGVE